MGSDERLQPGEMLITASTTVVDSTDEYGRGLADGMRKMAEAVREMVRKNYAGSEAKSFRHAFWRELKAIEQELGIDLSAAPTDQRREK